MTYKEFKKFRDEFLTEACLLSDNKSVEYSISNNQNYIILFMLPRDSELHHNRH